ncbi:MAG: hypothetical protein IIB95_10270 [Candidatus Marinimicrobia bacterium]|nr:hypothetical protein [Candidatus Neomarinimicrobiota bacterium]
MNDNMNIQKLFDEEIIDSDLVSKLKAVPNQMPTPINWNQLFDGTTIVLSFKQIFRTLIDSIDS